MRQVSFVIPVSSHEPLCISPPLRLRSEILQVGPKGKRGSKQMQQQQDDLGARAGGKPSAAVRGGAPVTAAAGRQASSGAVASSTASGGKNTSSSVPSTKSLPLTPIRVAPITGGGATATASASRPSALGVTSPAGKPSAVGSPTAAKAAAVTPTRPGAAARTTTGRGSLEGVAKR